MKHLKSYFSIIFPLMMMLMMFSIYLIVGRTVDNYKQHITDDYAIVVITNTPLKTIDRLAGIKVKSIDPISRKKIIKDVQSNLSDRSIDLLNKKLPYFYQIYLDQFPTSRNLKQIRAELSKISNIKKIEMFSNDHNKVYALLVIVDHIVFILFSVVFILSMLLLLKQIKIWFFEHSERISIIQLHGGSLLWASKPLIKIILNSSIISSLIVSLLIYIIISKVSLFLEPEVLLFLPKDLSLQMEIIKIVLLSLAIPIGTFVGLLIKYKMR